jgi:hypothetical protein
MPTLFTLPDVSQLSTAVSAQETPNQESDVDAAQVEYDNLWFYDYDNLLLKDQEPANSSTQPTDQDRAASQDQDRSMSDDGSPNVPGWNNAEVNAFLEAEVDEMLTTNEREELLAAAAHLDGDDSDLSDPPSDLSDLQDADADGEDVADHDLFGPGVAPPNRPIQQPELEAAASRVFEVDGEFIDMDALEGDIDWHEHL